MKILNNLFKLSLIGLTSLSVVSCSNNYSDLEKYAKEIYMRDFGHLEKYPKGFDNYPMGWMFQYRSQRCFLMYGNKLGEVWNPFFDIARSLIGEGTYSLRKLKRPLSGGLGIYDENEKTQTCLKIDFNPINGNNDLVAHPDEIWAKFNQIYTLKY